jgi:hypothetical protein
MHSRPAYDLVLPEIRCESVPVVSLPVGLGIEDEKQSDSTVSLPIEDDEPTVHIESLEWMGFMLQPVQAQAADVIRSSSTRSNPSSKLNLVIWVLTRLKRRKRHCP